MHYIELADASSRVGLKLVLTKGVPGPWGELVKAILAVKNVSYTAIAQYPGKSDKELCALSGQTSAPVMINDGVCTSDLKEIILLLEKNYPTPPLLPVDTDELATIWQLIDLIAGNDGFAWNRRLMMLAPLMELDPPLEMINSLAAKYGYSQEVAAIAPQKVLLVLEQIASSLNIRANGEQKYIVGNRFTVIDITWAVFCSMLLPLPEAVNAMPPGMRNSYTLDKDLMLHVDSILIEHRDYIYKNHLTLPLDY
jgi:glutathione S-transferase